MREQGIPEEEIARVLSEQNVSPKAIRDALGQSRIKEAVSDENSMRRNEEDIGGQDFYTPPSPSGRNPVPYPKTQEEENYGEYAPQPSEEYYQQPQPYPPVSQEFYPQEGYDEYYSGGTDTDTMMEVAEQVFSEKIKKIQNQIEDMTEFRTIAQTKINSLSERLNRIESVIDRLQAAILQRIGDYGSTLDSIRKEMSMMQDSFGKMIPAIAERHSSPSPVAKSLPEKPVKKFKR